ncbi:hypothetical protein KME66_24370 [Streptomyces sp. YPW6]|uniref:hypothetical protein n=1 Tax=Streptomyces sp. YPW6 TaxID=2840373 RepID=UPI001C0E3D79|nr:hypothetical protein [Streptomyces sp. YPW6]QWQ43759.1 hypothetical protein KME66_24370 [Streptomyces sp. YPW6]
MADRIPALTVVQTADGWKHFAFVGDHYVEFDETRVLDSGEIGGGGGRWGSVVPETFWQDNTGAGVVNATSVPYGDPQFNTYTLVKGEELVIFRDLELLEQTTVAKKWAGVSSWLAGASLQALAPTLRDSGEKFLALAGDRYCFFLGDGKLVENGVIADKWRFLPSRFHADIDSAAIIVGSPRWRYLCTKGSEVVLFDDSGILEGPRPISEKWPHLVEQLREWDAAAPPAAGEGGSDTGATRPQPSGEITLPAGAIERKLSDATWPGFEDFRQYFESCAQRFWDYRASQGVHATSSAIVFGDGEVKQIGTTLGSFGRLEPVMSEKQDEMVRIMNTPEFRAMYNLLPAGTHVVTAFCQLYVLKYRQKLGLANARGTYTLTFSVWPHVSEHQNEAQLSQETLITYSASGTRKNWPVTVCL